MHIFSENSAYVLVYILFLLWFSGFSASSLKHISNMYVNYYNLSYSFWACNAGDPGLIPGSGRSPGEGIGYLLQYSWASLVAQTVKNLPEMWETWVRFLGWEDSPEGGHGNLLLYSCLVNSHGQRSLAGYSPWGHKVVDMAEQLSTAHIHNEHTMNCMAYRQQTFISHSSGGLGSSIPRHHQFQYLRFRFSVQNSETVFSL